ncbi:hypothetical protein OIO90_004744 [Microbotryomycetes sp. JL221]|nr:hypothetical protein OIO90_004744 [Microbotryomycetes sp. JL221]
MSSVVMTSTNVKHSSPTTTRGKFQPLGTTSQQRRQQQQSPVMATTTTTTTTRKRSLSASGFKLARSASLPSQQRRNSTSEQRSSSSTSSTTIQTINNVFCDVVVDDLEVGRVATDRIYPAGNLGTRVTDINPTTATMKPSTPGKQRATPTTPRKVARPDDQAVRRHLRELHDTESSYLRKIESLDKHFARPLRTFARDKNTAVIDPFVAAQLFINIEQLVPVSRQFEQDLAQVRNMEPFRKWLASYASADVMRRELERSSTSFKQFVDRKQVESREETGQTGGFTEFLAEPFQRVSRYRLMLDPIIAHLDSDDENVQPLEDAIDILTDICSMERDDATGKAATLWALMETIEGFPASLVGYDRTFLTAIDVDEIVESGSNFVNTATFGTSTLSSSSSSNKSMTLKCCLLLFSDKMMIVKRPSGSSRTTLQHVGLEDHDALVSLYRSAQLNPSTHLSSSTTSNVVSQLLGSPRKFHNTGSNQSANSSHSGQTSSTTGVHSSLSLKKNSLGYRGHVDLLDIESIDNGTTSFTLVLNQPPSAYQTSERWCDRPVRRYVVSHSIYGDNVDIDDSQRRRIKQNWMKTLIEAQCRSWTERGSRGAWIGKSTVIDNDDLASGVASNVHLIAWDRRDWERLAGAHRNKMALYLDNRDGESPDLIAGSDGNPTTIARALFLGQDRVRFSIKSKDLSTKATETISFDRIGSVIAELGASQSMLTDIPDSSSSRSERKPRPRSAIFSAALDVFTGGASSLKRMHSNASRTSTTTANSWMSSTALSSVNHVANTGGSSALNSPKRTLSTSQAQSPTQSHAQSQPSIRPGQSTVELPKTASPRRRKPVPSLYDFVPHDTRVDVGRDVLKCDDSPIIAKGGSMRNSRHQRCHSMPAPSFDDNHQDSFDKPECREDNNSDATDAFEDAPEDAALSMDFVNDETMTSVSSTAPSMIAFPTLPQPAPLRRRMMGPRAPGDIRSSPLRATPSSSQLHSQDSRQDERMPSTPDRSVDSIKRPLYEPSPRATPAKRASISEVGGTPTSMPRGPSPMQSRRLVSGDARRVSKRIVSGTSTIRGLSPSTEPKPLPSEEMDVFDDDSSAQSSLNRPIPLEFVVDPIDRLKKHVDELRSKISLDVVAATAGVAGKENDRIVSPGGLSRSPHTRNVSLKANNGTPSSSTFATTFSESRKAAATVDVPALLRWTDRLSTLVDSLPKAVDVSMMTVKSTSPVTPIESGPTKAEIELLEQERDLLMAENQALKQQVTKRDETEMALRQSLQQNQLETYNIRQAYQDIVSEVSVAYDEFNDRLEFVVNTLQQEASNRDPEFTRLGTELVRAVQDRTTMEKQLRALQRSKT